MPKPTGSDGSLAERLVALAVLKANWDEKEQSYVDTFLPFFMDCAYAAGGDRVPVSELRQCVAREFGPNIPDASVRLVLRRATQQSLGSVDRHDWTFDRQSLARFDSTRLRADLAREQAALVRELRDYAAAEHGAEMSSEQAEATLTSHLSAAGSGVLLRVAGRDIVTTPAEDFVTAAFIDHVLAEQPVTAQYLERLVVGTMLAAAIHQPDINELADPFRDLTAYVDTPIVIDLLGRSGDVPRDSARESMRLLNQAGARIACFEHTAAEARSIFHGLADTLRLGFRRGRPPAYGTVEEYAITNGLSSSDLLAMAESISADLRRLGVDLVTPPAPSAETVVVDETQAVEMLQRIVHGGRPTAKRAAEFDLDSLTATYRLRTGRRDSLETAQAVFVTRSRALARAALVLFPPSRVGTQIALHASDLVTIAWLKKPRELPNLPRLRLAADAYAALRPSTILIERYTDILVDLENEGQVTESELYELRYATEAHKILMAKTHGDEARLDEPTVVEVLEETRRTVQEAADASARTELEVVRLQLQQAQSAREEAERQARESGTAVERTEGDVARLRRNLLLARLAFAFLVAAIVAAGTYLLWGKADAPLEQAAVLAGAALGAGAAAAVGLGRRHAAFLLGALAFVIGLLDGLKGLLD